MSSLPPPRSPAAAADAERRCQGGKKKTQNLGEKINGVHLDHLRDLFYEADEDGNGSLDINEFCKTLGCARKGMDTRQT